MKLSVDALYERYKKMYDTMYSISICQEKEIDDVVVFIDKYWKKNHALVKSKKLLDWQYFDKKKNTYNFIIAREKKTNEIHAIEGFIPTSQFDPLIKNTMTWGAIWKAIPDIAPPGLGFVVKQYREHCYASKYNCEIGISSDAMKYNRSYGNSIFFLENWYIVNPIINDFKLMISSSQDVDRVDNFDIEDIEIEWEEISVSIWNKISNELDIPEYKSKDYYVNRYYKHPIYSYHAVLLTNKYDDCKEAFFYRVAKNEGNRCVFVVDYIGQGLCLSKSHFAMIEILKKHNAEYILFPCYGIDCHYLCAAGFKNTKNTNDIVPLYYEPFLKQNVTIACASKASDITWLSFKGDADQDRPNLVQG